MGEALETTREWRAKPYNLLHLLTTIHTIQSNYQLLPLDFLKKKKKKLKDTLHTTHHVSLTTRTSQLKNNFLKIQNKKEIRKIPGLKTYVMEALMKSEGELAVELSLERIRMSRSSGKESNKSTDADDEEEEEEEELVSGESLFRFRQTQRSPVKSFFLFF